MTINSMLPAYREEANNITKDEYVKSKMILLAQRAFADGVTSILQVNAKKSKTTKEATVQLNENISEYYIDKNLNNLYCYFLSIIDKITKKGKLIINYETIAKEDFISIIKAAYDMGLLSGITVAQDPAQLEVFLNNKENIESGSY